MQRMPLFNLETLIQTHNETMDTHYPINETFEFEFFNPKLLEGIQETLRAIYHGIDAQFFTEEEKKYLKQRKERLLATKAYCQHLTTEKPSGVISDPFLETRIKSKEYYLNRLTYQHTQLSDEKNWQRWLIEANACKTLKDDWEKQQWFATHTNAALLEASMLMVILIDHHQRAMQALKSFKYRVRIPTLIYKAYHEYLTVFLHQAHQVQQQIAHAMLARLKMYDQQKPNVMVAVFSDLQQQGAKLKHRYEPLPDKEDPLTSAQLTAYHQCIVQYGHKDTQQQLKQLSWFHPSDVFPTVERITPHAVQLIPERLANAVPKQARKPTWLFKGENMRHHFFKEKIALLVFLKQSLNVASIRMDLKNTEALLSDIHRQEEAIEGALIELNDKKYQSFSFVFQRKTRQFLAEWQQLLVQHRQQQLENKLLLAEKLSATWVGRNVLDTAVYAWRHCQQLQDILIEIQHDIERLGDCHRFKERVGVLLQQQSHLLKLNRIVTVFRTLADGNSVTESEFYFFTRYMQWLQLRDEKHYQALLELCFLQRAVIADKLSEMLKHFFTLPQHNEVSEQLLCLNLMVCTYGDDKDKVALDSKIKKFFLRFLEAILNTIALHKNVAVSPLLTSAQTVFNAIGQSVTLAGLPLTYYLLAIQSVQHNPRSLKCKCLALATQLAEEFLMTRYQKDTQQLDEKIEQTLLSHPTLEYTLSHMRILMQIRDKAVQENKPLAALSLKKSEQRLVGLLGDDIQAVKPLLEASIHAHQAAQEINQKQKPLKQKMLCLHALHAQLQSTLQPVSFNLLQSRSTKRGLFSKFYLNATLLPDETPSLPEKPLATTLTY